MSLQTILDSLTSQPGQAETVITIPSGWTQGRATFGGLVAAIMQAHLQRSLGEERPLRSANIIFVGPAAPGEVTLRSELIRSGKSVLQAECRMLQNGAVVGLMTACFGNSRESRLHIPAAPAPSFRAPDDCRTQPFIPGLTPEFLQHFDLRRDRGDLPFTGGTSAEIAGWVRLREPVADINAAVVMALIDAWPPTVIGMFDTLAPISTLSWSMEFLAPAQAIAADGWWQYLADTDCSRDGYVNAHSSLWSPTGELVAINRQTVTIFY